jgi:hypothetical protein
VPPETETAIARLFATRTVQVFECVGSGEAGGEKHTWSHQCQELITTLPLAEGGGGDGDGSGSGSGSSGDSGSDSGGAAAALAALGQRLLQAIQGSFAGGTYDLSESFTLPLPVLSAYSPLLYVHLPPSGAGLALSPAAGGSAFTTTFTASAPPPSAWVDADRYLLSPFRPSTAASLSAYALALPLPPSLPAAFLSSTAVPPLSNLNAPLLSLAGASASAGCASLAGTAQSGSGSLGVQPGGAAGLAARAQPLRAAHLAH